jgi:DNA-binding winged helix-turn-helix (wHTH) protein
MRPRNERSWDLRIADGLPMTAAETPSGIDLAREPDFDIGGLAVRPSTREVAHGDDRQTLEPRVMQALVALARRRGEVVSRDELIHTCWDGRIVGDDAINGCVAKVRRLGETHGAFTIETIPRVGYRLADAVRPRLAEDQRRRPRQFALVVGASLAVGVAALLISLWSMRQPAPVRVAVLPFETGAGDVAARALASRVRDQISGVLTARQVEVMAPGSARGARLVVAGTLERTGEVAQVRIHVDDPGSHLVLWQGIFEGPASIDSPLAQRAAAKVTDLVYAGVTIIGEGKGRVEPQALKSFILGRDAQRDGRRDESVEFFRAFRDRQPGLAVGHAFYATMLGNAASYQPPAVAAAWRAEGVQSAQKALKLNPNTAQGYWALASLTPQYERREQILSEGLKRAPNDGSLNTSQGVLLAELGRPREGLAYIRRGEVLDPLSAPKQFGDSIPLVTVGLVDEARAQLNNAYRIWPEGPNVPGYFTAFAVDAAAPAEARRILTGLRATNPAYAQEADLWLDYVKALDCRCRLAEAGRALLAAARSDRVDPGWVVPALVRLGQIDLAYEAAEQTTGRGAGYRMLLFADIAAPMLREPRFMDLAARLGLAQYWLASNRWPEFCAEPGLPYDCKVEAARAAAKKS